MRKGHRGKAKGPRMIKEIQRLREMGLSKRKIAKALGCSRNTVDKYLSEQESTPKQPAEYRAPWSEQVDWQAVNAAVNKGEPLSECWETLPTQQEIPYVSFWRE